MRLVVVRDVLGSIRKGARKSEEVRARPGKSGQSRKEGKATPPRPAAIRKRHVTWMAFALVIRAR
jgi:hypothetical protein